MSVPREGDLWEFRSTRVADGHARDWNNCNCRHRDGHLPPEFVPAGPHWVESVSVEPVDHVTYWADNSIEVVSVSGLRHVLVGPHGDVCF